MSGPRDIRHIIGKSEWTKSLKTSNVAIAADKRAALIAKCHQLVLKARGELSRRDIDEAPRLLDRGFDRPAHNRNSMDVAIAEQLALLGSMVITSWEPNEPGKRNSWGDWSASEPVADRQAIPSIDDEAGPEVFPLRAQLSKARGELMVSSTEGSPSSCSTVVF